jgi:hypothetical protein
MGLPIGPTAGYPFLAQPHERSFSTTSGEKDEPDMTSVDPSLPMRPYSYYTGFNPALHRIGKFREEISAITSLTDSKQAILSSSSLKTLARLTPYELDAFKYEFQQTTGKSLHEFCNSLIAKEDDKVKTLLAGLTLGPLEFDLYLLGKARFAGKVDDDLIIMFVGREQRDLQYLNARWRDQNGGSLASAITSWKANENLQYALKICTSNNRDSPTKPVDYSLDVNRLVDLLKMTYGGGHVSTDLLDIILYRNDPGIQQLALYFETATGYKLDEKIRKSALDEMTKKIAVHAVRTAQDPVYRDLMLLKDVMGKSGREVDLGIRVCRGHWYGVHWRQIQAAAKGIMSWEVREKVGKMSKGVFKELLMAMIPSY